MLGDEIGTIRKDENEKIRNAEDDTRRERKEMIRDKKNMIHNKKNDTTYLCDNILGLQARIITPF